MFPLADVEPAQAATLWAQRVLMTEAAGLFWLLAELGILFAMLLARRFLESRPIPERLRLTRREQVRLLLWLAAFAAIAACVLERHLHEPALAALIRASHGPDEVRALFHAQSHIHMKIWAVFTTAFVALEMAIVWQGWRAYRGFRALIPKRAKANSSAASIAVLILSALLVAARDAAAISYADTLRQAFAEDAVYRNAMYLYLRLAGVVWIGVEWFAAILLWRASRDLRLTIADLRLDADSPLPIVNRQS